MTNPNTATTTTDLKDLTLLADICQQYLGLSYVVARRRQGAGTLPVKAFRLSGSRRGPLFVHNDDIARLIETRRRKAPSREPRGSGSGEQDAD